MDRGYFLTESDVRILKGMAAHLRNTDHNPSSPLPTAVHSPYLDNGQGPEVYVVQAPEEGIPAAVVDSSISFRPGIAETTVYTYQERDGLPEDGEYQIVELNQRVHNISPVEIEPHSWCVVSRTKYGDWVIVGVGVQGTGGTGTAGTGTGTGTGDDCIVTTLFECNDGILVATIKRLRVDAAGVLEECDSFEQELGPCAPHTPEGFTFPVVTKVCPVFQTIQYLDWSSQHRSVNVVTGIRVERRLITVPRAEIDPACITNQTGCCTGTAGTGTGDGCFLQCSPCHLNGGMASVWEMIPPGGDSILLFHIDNPSDANFCRFRSSDWTWEMYYDHSSNVWFVVNREDESLWFIDGDDFVCLGQNSLFDVDDFLGPLLVRPTVDCTTITGTGGGVSAPCPDGHSYTTCHVTNKTAECACLPDTMTYTGPFPPNCQTWTSGSFCEGTISLKLCCTGGHWTCEVTSGGSGFCTLMSYVPGTIVFDSPLLGCAGAGACRFTFTA